MSFEINPSTPLLSRTPLPVLQQSDPLQKQTPPATVEESALKSAATPQSTDTLQKAVAKVSAGREHEDKHSLKTFTELVRSLEKSFGKASKVDRDTGLEEMRKGGLRRIGKDLRKLFKGLGLPPQLAKQISRGMTEAMQNQDVEQLNFSLTATRSVNLEIHQVQAGYQASGDGSTSATATADSLQLSAVQVRSLEVSLNLSTGEFSMTRTRTETLTLNSSNTTVMASQGPPADTTAPELDTTAAAPATDSALPSAPATGTQSASAPTADTTTADPAAGTSDPTPAEQPAAGDDFAVQVQTTSQLLQISRIVQQSAIVQLKPATGVDNTVQSSEQQSNGGLRVLQDMLQQLEALRSSVENLFEPQVQVNDLRVEEENGDQHLRFNLAALAPIGLTAVDENARGTTIYPRPDDSLGKVEDTAVEVAA